MSLSNYEKEINEAISSLKIEEKVKIFEGEKKREFLQKMQDFFVVGNPRVWWLSLKYKPVTFVFEQEDSYKRITDFLERTKKCGG